MPAFSGAALAGEAYGQKSKIRFVGTWANGDTWTIPFVATVSGDFTLGKGNIAGQTFTCAFKLRDRMYLGMSNSFALSSNGDVTLWEEQDPGAAVISYLSQFGPQDAIVAIAAMQGRLVVIAGKSIQIWQPDADPNNLALQQTLDNTGTRSMLSVKTIGDADVLYLDTSGIRSLRAKFETLNAFVNDIGTAIDLLIRAALVGYDATLACAIVEPTTRQYWLFLNGSIYVLSHYPESKITAWSTYKPTTEVTKSPASANYDASGNVSYTGLTSGGIYGWTKGANDTSFTDGTTTLTASGGIVVSGTTATGVGTALAAVTSTLVRVDTAFTPQKFVVYNNQVYVRSSSDNKIYYYGGSDGNTFDRCRATVELPWLNLEASTILQAMGVDAAFAGAWAISAGMAPRQTTLIEIMSRGSASSPSMVNDSTFDTGHYPYSANGTHFKLKAVSGINATAAKLAKMTFLYQPGNVK